MTVFYKHWKVCLDDAEPVIVSFDEPVTADKAVALVLRIKDRKQDYVVNCLAASSDNFPEDQVSERYDQNGKRVADNG